MNQIPNGDVATDAVDDVLEHLFGVFAFSEANDGTGYTVLADGDTFHHADYIVGAVFEEEVCAAIEAAHANGGRRAIKNLDAPIALIGQL